MLSRNVVQFVLRPEPLRGMRLLKLGRRNEKPRNRRKKRIKQRYLKAWGNIDLGCCFKCQGTGYKDFKTASEGREAYSCREVAIECFLVMSTYRSWKTSPIRSRRARLQLFLSHRHPQILRNSPLCTAIQGFNLKSIISII